MTKADYMERHGLTLREVTAEDLALTRTDYERQANFIISNGACDWY